MRSLRKPTPPQAEPSSPTRVRASSPPDLLALVPYLLGFRPTESLVAMVIRHGQVLLTARVDLPPPQLRALVGEQFVSLANQHEAEGLVLFGFGEDPDATRAALGAVIPSLRPYGLLDAVYADGRRWWSLTCTDTCCPAEGTPYDAASSPLAAEAVYAGLATAPGRSAIEAQVSGPAADDAEPLARLGRDVARELGGCSTRRRAHEMHALVTGFLARPRALADPECARLAVLAADVAVRDIAWALMKRSDVEDHLDLWGQVVARTVAPWEAAPLCLLGMAAWIAGNGALQNCCSARARQIAPDYSLALLLDELNARALSPTLWDTMAADLTESLTLRDHEGRGPVAG